MLDLIRKAKTVQAVTEVVVVNNVAKTIDMTVPAGKLWLLLGIKITNPDNVARTVTFRKFKEAAKTNLVQQYDSQAVDAGNPLVWPYGAAVTGAYRRNPTEPFELLDEGNVLETAWSDPGASAGGTDADGLVVEYLEVDK